MKTDILIVGGGLGGVAGALAALRLGKRVILTEETDWLGGQMTAQAVPPDEHPWIEQLGCTDTYRQLRDGIRGYYRRCYPLKPEVSANPTFNPGQGSVSFLCHEPRVSLAVIESMLQPYRSGRQLQIFLRCRPVAAHTLGDRVLGVSFTSLETGEAFDVEAEIILDATELGDLLPLAEVEHITGAEAQSETGELHALPDVPDPLDQQPISWCYAIDYLPGEEFTIQKPADYDFWRSYQAPFWPAPHLSWTYSEPIDLNSVTRPIFAGPSDTEKLAEMDLWHYRRIFYRQHYPAGRYPSDITLVNWPQIDYWLGPVVGVSDEEARRHYAGSRQVSLSMLYWMQTEAPRPEGGYGYPGLRLRGDVTGTTDGLAKAAYIRESRRIRAEFTVCEQHVGMQARGGLQGAEIFPDSVGIGSYRIDLHPSTGGRNYIDIPSWPYQIPLGALLPQRIENLLPACKNLGVTHITNGCYRLHPAEWNIGESAGALAAFCLERRLAPRQVRHTPALLADFQRLLSDQLGIPLAWPEEMRLTPRNKANPLGF
jgi:hypothetical protein